jgi:hypothetical protein
MGRTGVGKGVGERLGLSVGASVSGWRDTETEIEKIEIEMERRHADGFARRCLS